MLGLARRGVGAGDLDAVRPVASAEALREARAQVDATRVEEDVARYVVAVVRRTRELPSVELGASPRAAVHLLGAARAAAAARGPRLRDARRRRRGWPRPSSGTGSCSRRRPSSSATAPTTPCGPRSATCPCPGEARRPAPRARCPRRRRAPLATSRARHRRRRPYGRADRRARWPARRSPTRSPSGAAPAARAAGGADPRARRRRARSWSTRSPPAPARCASASRSRPTSRSTRARRTGALDARLTPLRRGRHTLGAVARARTEGPLGLGRWHHRAGEEHEVLVYPRPARRAGSRWPCARAASASRAG